MSIWSDGYTSEIDYIPTYTTGLNLAHMRSQLLVNGVVPPDVHNACELGFGVGQSVAIHTASSTAKWWGTDFNPSHAAAARHLTGAPAAGRLFDQSFAEFCQRDDLPEFEFIGLHGIWSWISDENRHVLVDFIRRKLAVGGVLYISYNTLPGWSTKAPLRHLFRQYAQRMVAPASGLPAAMGQAHAFASQLLKTATGLSEINPDMARHLESLGEKNVHYLVHEYLNGDWQPMYFSQVHDWLSAAKVDFVCEDSFDTSYLPCQFSGEVLALVQGIGDAVFQQDVRDYCRNTMFRRDYWVKGPQKAAPAVLEGYLRQQRACLKTANPEGLDKLGIEPAAQVSKLAALLQQGGTRPHTVAELHAAMPDLSMHDLYRILHLMSEKGHILLMQPQEQALAVRASCQAFNQRALEQFAVQPDEMLYLAAAGTGGALGLSYLDAVMALAHHRLARSWQVTDSVQEDDLVAFARDCLLRHNRTVQQNGQPLTDPEQIRTALHNMARNYLEHIASRLHLMDGGDLLVDAASAASAA